MANEIIKKTERFILVQIDKEGTERVLYQDFVVLQRPIQQVMHKILNLRKTLKRLLKL